jgi:hypothetical protein
MQTFLPFPDFRASLETLDRGRLGKQRLEVCQLVEVVLGGRIVAHGDGYQLEPYAADDYPRFVRARRNHPACRMWDGYLPALIAYGLLACLIWRERGFNDTTHGKLVFAAVRSQQTASTHVSARPSWFGDADFHYAHRANLVRKDLNHYYPWFPDVDLITAPFWPYVYPPPDQADIVPFVPYTPR